MRPPSPPEWLAQEVARQARDRGGLLVLADFDGTLAPIVPSPRTARMTPAGAQALEALAGRPDTAVAIVSGRDLADVQARVPVPGVIHAGCHGLEIQGPGASFVHPEAAGCRPLLTEAAATLAETLAPLRGVEVESKTLAVAVHYRRARPSDLTEVFYQVEQIYEAHESRLAQRHGKKVIELVPDVAWNKGECALWIRDRWAQELTREPAVVYMGDDLTDEDAFQALRGKATTVRVGPGPRTSAAIRWVADVTAAGRFLGALARALDGASAAAGIAGPDSGTVG